MTETIAQVLERVVNSDMSADTAMLTFMAACLQQDNHQQAETTGVLIKSYQDEIAELYKLVNDIRRLIKAACSDEYAPSVARIVACLYPTPSMLAELDRHALA